MNDPMGIAAWLPAFSTRDRWWWCFWLRYLFLALFSLVTAISCDGFAISIWRMLTRLYSTTVYRWYF